MMKCLRTLTWLPIFVSLLGFHLTGCSSMKRDTLPSSDPSLPVQYPISDPEKCTALVGWREYFKDPNLTSLIGSALENNQELNILLQEIAVSKSEVLSRKGAVLPFAGIGAEAGLEKPGLYTTQGAVEENLPIKPGKEFPEPLPNYRISADFTWEVDIWRKLRNERDAAIKRYLGTQEGRNFTITHLVAEIAESYYELLGLDSRLAILQAMIGIQENAFGAVKQQKEAGKATELAVKRFEAEVLKNRAELSLVHQRIIESENHLNFLAGRYPQHIQRDSSGFEQLMLDRVHAGLPVELLRNRPDVRKAEYELVASGLEVKAAAARFYPSLDLSGALGLETFTLSSAFDTPESVVYSAVAGVAAPLINRSAIKAAYNGANAEQVAAIYDYQQTVLRAYVEVVNQIAEIQNLNQAYLRKSEQVRALSESVAITGQLYSNARADYTEVLLTQRDALEARLDLIELKQRQLAAFVRAYKALGGGYNRGQDEVAARGAE